MAATINVCDPIADFTLPDTGGAPHSSAEARKDGLLLFAFYKKTCPTCQYALPFLQRFHAQYAGDRFHVWGVVQESVEEAKAFAAEYGAVFPQLVDQNLDVTEEYRITHVPSVYLTDAAGKVLRFVPAFSTEDFNAMAQIVAERTGAAYTPIVRPEDNAPAIKPG